MDDEKLNKLSYWQIFEKIKNKELTICETCDNIFDYVQQKVFCDECHLKRPRRAQGMANARYRLRYKESGEKRLAYQRKYREKNREKINARQRKYLNECYHYRVKKDKGK